jgi:hypothetical protein
MKWSLLLLFIVCCLFGCGAAETGDIQTVESQYTVIDLEGKERQISASELIDADTGKPTVHKVLVIDRQAKNKSFVEATQLQSQSPSAPRYFPVTSNAASTE